jgi:hypothetical protein
MSAGPLGTAVPDSAVTSHDGASTKTVAIGDKIVGAGHPTYVIVMSASRSS